MKPLQLTSGDDILGRISVVLIEPQSPGNIGATARALHNMGVSRLVLVRPADPTDLEARRMAMGGAGILAVARVVETQMEAVSDAGLVIGTTRRAGKNRGPVLDIGAAVARAATAAAAGSEVALVFGREDSGLTTAELGACHLLARIPTSEENASLNLAQAVLLALYELRRQVGEGVEGDGRRRASTREMEGMFAQMAEVLDEIRFLNPQNPEEIVLALRRLFGRAEMDPREVRIIRGMLRQIRWAARTPPPLPKTRDIHDF